MPPKTAKTPAAPSTMKELKDTLWKAADKLRGSMDASQYKDVILGLVFLKYVSDAYDERRAAIRADLAADRAWTRTRSRSSSTTPRSTTATASSSSRRRPAGPTSRQQRQGPPAADAEPAKTIGELVDEAMDLVMGANPSLARHPAADLQPGQRRPAPPRRADRPLQQRPVHPPGRGPGPRPARRGLRVLPGEVRPRRGQAGRRVLHPRQRRQGARRRCSSRPTAGSTTRAAAPAACSSRPRSSSTSTTATPRTCTSTARSSTSAPGGWPR